MSSHAEYGEKRGVASRGWAHPPISQPSFSPQRTLCPCSGTSGERHGGNMWSKSHRSGRVDSSSDLLTASPKDLFRFSWVQRGHLSGDVAECRSDMRWREEGRAGNVQRCKRVIDTTTDGAIGMRGWKKWLDVLEQMATLNTFFFRNKIAGALFFKKLHLGDDIAFYFEARDNHVTFV